jgi:hypothetical protein
MCCNIPSDGNYFLTSFCAGYPHSQTSCGSYCDQYRYFTADRQRYGCNGKFIFHFSSKIISFFLFLKVLFSEFGRNQNFSLPFGVLGYLNICANGKCVKAKVIDAGPAAWVEEVSISFL